MQQLPRPPASAPSLLARIGFGLAAIVAIGVAAVLISATLVVGLVVGLVVVVAAWATLRWQFWRAGLRWPPWQTARHRSAWNPGAGSVSGSSARSAATPGGRRESNEVIDMELREVEPARRARSVDPDRES